MENYSKQREEIIEVLESSKNHPTAEEIYLKLKENLSTSSRSTIYRNLALLVNKKVILKISMPIGPDRYDLIKNKHNHAICTECGKVFDFECKFNFKELKESVYNQTSLECSEDTFCIAGICKECKQISKLR